MDSLTKEIKRALRGGLVQEKDRLAVSWQTADMYRYGVRDGALNAAVWGVMKHRQWYYIDRKCRNFEEKALKAMQDMGRMLNLAELEGGDAVYIGYVFGKPTILTYTRRKDRLVLCAYTSRSLFGIIGEFRALNTFARALGEDISRFSRDSEKKLRAEEAAGEKAEKKREKAEKKAARKQRLTGMVPGAEAEGYEEDAGEDATQDEGTVTDTANDAARDTAANETEDYTEEAVKDAGADTGSDPNKKRSNTGKKRK